MSVTATLDSYLHNKSCDYDTVPHSFSSTASESALMAAVPMKQVIKAVVLHDNNHYMLAAVPAMNKVMLPQIEQITGCHTELAKEAEIERIFGDCELGAVPAIGQAYGLDVIWDDSLCEDDDLYIEAGDHRNLIHIKREQFQELMKNNPHGHISCAPEELYDLTHY
ncbi:aminoacyl-tRNA deacylase [Neptuniibacter sp.]|uniref:aminoacyl-tRNA deacylase n=1 Tax=Neptuniibacter sp. TaxID=1962643 RepID=UPI002630BE7E|nr:YbaK/EbsC family protein [Neptuniibacter sp.]MCP4597504.1 YbaK/EbsC family protein [Neptuniibacter sp.]